MTRLKTNADYITLKKRSVPNNRNILSDDLIEFTGYYAHKDCPHTLHKVVVWDKVNNQAVVLSTNHLKFRATTISTIYKDRWQIELFFKALKQNPKVKTFVGMSENALYIQICTALIAIYGIGLIALSMFCRYHQGLSKIPCRSGLLDCTR